MAFKKGVATNPYGSLPVGDDLKFARKLTRNEFEMICHKYMFMSAEQLQNAVQNKSVPSIDMMIISIINKAIVEGDQKRMDFLIDRMIGSVVRKVRVQYEDEVQPNHAPVAIDYREKLAMLDKMRDIYAKKAKEDDEKAGIIEVTPHDRG